MKMHESILFISKKIYSLIKLNSTSDINSQCKIILLKYTFKMPHINKLKVSWRASTTAGARAEQETWFNYKLIAVTTSFAKPKVNRGGVNVCVARLLKTYISVHNLKCKSKIKRQLLEPYLLWIWPFRHGGSSHSFSRTLPPPPPPRRSIVSCDCSAISTTAPDTTAMTPAFVFRPIS